MKILIGCEFSGMVREAFRGRGYNAISCDILPSELPGPHIQADISQILNQDWDMMIAFPPCTHLSSSGARWFKDKQELQKESIRFALELASANIPRIAIENPIGILSTKWRKPDQIIQPYNFGDNEQKSTCLWLKNLPRLRATRILTGQENIQEKVWLERPSKDRWKIRSRFLPGVSHAMAEQWGKLLE